MKKVTFRDLLSHALGDDALPADAAPALDEILPDDSLGAREYGRPGVFRPDAAGRLPDLLVSGVPGSGKTRLAQALAVACAVKGGTVFYAAPTRPLAQENADSLRLLTQGVLDKDDIILSTGDKCTDDWKLHQKTRFICCTIFEKLLSLLLSSRTLRKKVSLVIVDEAHMFNEDSRGVRLDMLISQLTADEERKGRVVLLTVESCKNCEFLLEALEKWDDGESVPPLRLSGSNRPGTVEHKVALQRVNKISGELHMAEMPLTVLSPGSPLYLSEEECAEKGRAVAEFMNREEAVSRSDWKSFPLDVRAVEKWCLPGRNVLVVNMSMRLLKEGLGKMLAARKEGKIPCHADAAAFRQRLEELAKAGIISNRQRRHFGDWARYGLYLHTGDMHAALREAVEQAFRESSKEGRVLFSTTTLAYGVNLAIDTVLLTSLTFSMDDAAPRYVDGVVLHNIMGRAARRPDGNGEAVVLLPALRDTRKKALVSGKLAAALMDCYRPKGLPLLSPNPLAGEEGPFPASPSSESHTRTLYFFLYALEFAAQRNPKDGWLNAGQVAEELRRCVHARTAWKDKGWEAFQRFVADTLDGLSRPVDLCPGFEMRFVEARGEGRERRWRGTSRGRALLNCGVSVREVEMLSRWFSKAGSVFGEREKTASPLYWLAALVTLPSLQKILSTGYDGDNPPQCGDEAFLRTLGKRDRAPGLHQRFLPLFDEFCAAAGEAEWEKRKGIPKRKEILDSVRSRSRLALLALWKWMEGKPLEEVEMAFGLSTSARQFFPPRLTERSAWILLFIPQFFVESPLLGPKEAFCAGRLEARMRWGLPERLLPYRGESDFSRERAGELAAAGDASSLILDVDKGEAGLRARENMRMVMEQLRIWVDTVLGDREFAAMLWECLDAGLRGNWKETLEVLHKECPDVAWARMFKKCRKDLLLRKIGAALAVVALFRGGLWDVRREDSVPDDLEGVFALLIDKGHGWNVAGPLAFIHLP